MTTLKWHFDVYIIWTGNKRLLELNQSYDQILLFLKKSFNIMHWNKNSLFHIHVGIDNSKQHPRPNTGNKHKIIIYTYMKSVVCLNEVFHISICNFKLLI